MSNRKPRGYWTLERCMEDASQYRSRSEWLSGSASAHQIAKRNGWLERCCKHMSRLIRPKGYWTLERCIEDAAPFSKRTDWKRLSGAGYDAAKKRGWLDKCCVHMEPISKVSGYWNLVRCMEDAAQYLTQMSWKSSSGSAWGAAQRNGWLEQCCEHMDSDDCGTDNDVVYIWRDAGTGLHKVGITSDRIGEKRINLCSSHNDMDPRIVFMLKVADARAVESQLLELGTDPQLDSSIDGYTEFRRLTDAELGRAVSIAYEAALAA
jgi:hypothetical protein